MNKKYTIIYMVLFSVSLILLFMSIIYDYEKLCFFWMPLLGYCFGAILWEFIRTKKNYKGDTKVFFRILLIATCSAVLTALLYMLLKERSIVYILFINGCTLTYSVCILVKSIRDDKDRPKAL